MQSNKHIFFLHLSPFTFIVINCTSLTQMVDPGGPLRMSNCANHFGTQCNFSCAIGYRLNGSSTVTCVAPGNQHSGVWNNTIPTCEGKQEKRKKRRVKKTSDNCLFQYSECFKFFPKYAVSFTPSRFSCLFLSALFSYCSLHLFGAACTIQWNKIWMPRECYSA